MTGFYFFGYGDPAADKLRIGSFPRRMENPQENGQCSGNADKGKGNWEPAHAFQDPLVNSHNNQVDEIEMPEYLLVPSSFSRTEIVYRHHSRMQQGNDYENNDKKQQSFCHVYSSLEVNLKLTYFGKVISRTISGIILIHQFIPILQEKIVYDPGNKYSTENKLPLNLDPLNLPYSE